jgi:hypothetical protein
MGVLQSPGMIVLRLLSSSCSLVPPSAYNLQSFGYYERVIVADL